MRRIAFCGTRGLPANYGGFETAVDEITRAFVGEGIECDVFCRQSDNGTKIGEYEGRRLIHVKGSKFRKLDTFISSIYTARYLIKNRHNYDHVFWFNNANVFGILACLTLGLPTTVNTDGLEWRRAKWSWPFKAFYFASTALICLLGARLISDSIEIQKYYKKVFHRNTIFIPYGHPEVRQLSSKKQAEVLADYGLEPGQYFLQITRIEPDNLPLAVAQGFLKSELGAKGYQLVVIGLKDDTGYAHQLRAISGHGGVQAMPAVYDAEVLQALRENCYCYVHGNSVGGTNPALIEAMLNAPRVLAIDSPFSKEVLGELGHFFQISEIAAKLVDTLNLGPRRQELRERVKGFYQWEQVAKAYIEIVKNGASIYVPVPEAILHQKE